MEPLETRHRFIELRAKGFSFDKISSELNVHKHTLIDWSKQLEQDITTHRAVELEQLYDSFLLVKEQRLKLLGRIFSKLQAEIERRDFAQLQTDKLLEILIKYDTQIREELQAPMTGGTGNKVEVVITRRQNKETLNKVNTLNKMNTK